MVVDGTPEKLHLRLVMHEKGSSESGKAMLLRRASLLWPSVTFVLRYVLPMAKNDST